MQFRSTVDGRVQEVAPGTKRFKIYSRSAKWVPVAPEKVTEAELEAAADAKGVETEGKPTADLAS